MKSAARQWDEVARHLVQAHGAAPDGLTGYTPTLEQLNFAHLDTHAALDLINARPPDGHTHAAALDPGWCDPRPSSFRPFPPSASAGRVRTSKDLFTFPESCQTGLPHTGGRPLTEAGLRDWARTVAGYRVRDGYDAFVLDCIKDDARAAAGRWLTRADFPRPVQAIRGKPASPRRAHAEGALPAGDQEAMNMEATDGRRSAIARDRSMSEPPNPVRTSRHPVFSGSGRRA